MNDKGWICVHRKIEDNPIICKDNDYFRVWHYLLYNATHKEIEAIFGKDKIILKPGQLITGRDKIAEKCKVSSSKVVRILKTFKIEHQIEQQTCSKGSLITLVNWDKYQKSEQQIEQRVNSEWTASEQQVNTNNNVTSKQVYTTTTTIHAKSENLYELVERTFGRTLSGSEFEIISTWDDNELTRYAIKQTELARVSNVKYIQRILQSYKKDNIKTVTEAEERDRRYQQRKDIKNTQNMNMTIKPDWMDKDLKSEEVHLTDEQKRELEQIKAGTYRT